MTKQIIDFKFYSRCFKIKKYFSYSVIVYVLCIEKRCTQYKYVFVYTVITYLVLHRLGCKSVSEKYSIQISQNKKVTKILLVQPLEYQLCEYLYI